MKATEKLAAMTAIMERMQNASAKERAELWSEYAILRDTPTEVGGGKKERTVDELEFCLLSQFGDTAKENKAHVQAAIRAFYSGDGRAVLTALANTKYEGYARAECNRKTVANLFEDFAKMYGITDVVFSATAVVGKRHIEDGVAGDATTQDGSAA